MSLNYSKWDHIGSDDSVRPASSPSFVPCHVLTTPCVPVPLLSAWVWISLMQDEDDPPVPAPAAPAAAAKPLPKVAAAPSSGSVTRGRPTASMWVPSLAVSRRSVCS
jgi:hypothetical protein